MVVRIFVETGFDYAIFHQAIECVWVSVWILRSFRNNLVEWGRKHLKIYSSALIRFFPQHENVNTKNLLFTFFT